MHRSSPIASASSSAAASNQTVTIPPSGTHTRTVATADEADGSITAISGLTYATGTITDND
ncbi:hypothetical protein [Candidatus Poriferisodalis sp.]|uniref:hypothetical protein n=1 Tax=Candidatus Poriferisodalis sp. TaxID=3101277 RepID=UPI003B52555A